MVVLAQDITTEELIKTDYHYNYSDVELRKDWKRLCETTTYKTGSQFKPGMKLCQHFFPNFFEISNIKLNLFEKCWQNEELMNKVREWGLKSMSKLWMSWIRRAVYLAGGLPNSSFYRPHFAKQIIETYKPNFEGNLFDPCAGWGGRMLGTVAAGWNYTACEPNKDTYNNLQKLIAFLDIDDRVEIYNMPVEEHKYKDEADIVLTSPPYFNLEVYDSNISQSYYRFFEYNTWKERWFIPLLEESIQNLSENGYSCWNVMNFGKQDLVETVMNVHQQKGYELVGTVGFKSPLANIRNLKNRDVTYIFTDANASITN